jgi:hypothetical protein
VRGFSLVMVMAMIAMIAACGENEQQIQQRNWSAALQHAQANPAERSHPFFDIARLGPSEHSQAYLRTGMKRFLLANRQIIGFERSKRGYRSGGYNIFSGQRYGPTWAQTYSVCLRFDYKEGHEREYLRFIAEAADYSEQRERFTFDIKELKRIVAVLDQAQQRGELIGDPNDNYVNLTNAKMGPIPGPTMAALNQAIGLAQQYRNQMFAFQIVAIGVKGEEGPEDGGFQWNITPPHLNSFCPMWS